MFNPEPLKPVTAEELREAETPNGIRKRLQRYARGNSLTHAVFNAAYAQGLSGEDTMTVLAYNALLRLEALEQRLLNDAMMTAQPLIMPNPTQHQTPP